MKIAQVSNYNVCQNNYLKQNFKGCGQYAGKTPVYKNAAKKLRNFIFLTGIATAVVSFMSNCGESSFDKKMRKVEEAIYSQPKIDSAAWAAYEEWDAENTPYWDQPGYDGPIYEEDFLEWQEKSNQFWENYYKEHPNK